MTSSGLLTGFLKLKPSLVLALAACGLVASVEPPRRVDTAVVKRGLADEILGTWEGTIFACCSNEVQADLEFRPDATVALNESLFHGGDLYEKRRRTCSYRIAGNRLAIEEFFVDQPMQVRIDGRTMFVKSGDGEEWPFLRRK